PTANGRCATRRRSHGRRWFPEAPAPLRRLALVQLDDPHALRRGLHAQVAERAFVEVLLDGLNRIGGRAELEDADRTYLGKLLGEARGLADHAVVRIHANEHRHRHAPSAASRSLTKRGMSPISSATAIPAARIRRILSAGESTFFSTTVP